MEQLRRFVFLAGIWVLPLFWWPWADVQFEIPKVGLFNRWVELLGLLGLLAVVKGGRLGQARQGVVLAAVIFVLAAIFSAFAGVSLGKSLVGNYYRQDGLITLFHLAGLFFFLLLFWRREWRSSLVLAVSGGALAASLVSLGAKVGLWQGWGVWIDGTIGGTFGQPKFLAGYLVSSLPFTFSLLRHARFGLRWFWVFGLVVQLIALCLTGAKGGGLGLLVAVLGWYFIFKVHNRKVLGGIAVVLFLVFGLVFGTNIFKKRANQFDYLPESRQRILVKGVIAFSQRPIFGWGWANFDQAFQAVDWPLRVENDVYVDKAHSGLLEVLVTTGLMGLIAYGYLLVSVIRILLESANDNQDWAQALFLVLLIWLVHSQTNVISINQELLFWLVAGISAATWG